MRIALLVVLVAFASACGIPDIGCPASQPVNGVTCTSTRTCSYASDAGPVVCHCVVAAGSTSGVWQCGH